MVFKSVTCPCCNQSTIGQCGIPDHRTIIIQARMGHYIAYCDIKCYTRHNHKGSYSLESQLKTQKDLTKKYLGYLKMYGYGQN